MVARDSPFYGALAAFLPPGHGTSGRALTLRGPGGRKRIPHEEPKRVRRTTRTQARAPRREPPGCGSGTAPAEASHPLDGHVRPQPCDCHAVDQPRPPATG
jgi:hypothetical protein